MLYKALRDVYLSAAIAVTCDLDEFLYRICLKLYKKQNFAKMLVGRGFSEDVAFVFDGMEILCIIKNM